MAYSDHISARDFTISVTAAELAWGFDVEGFFYLVETFNQDRVLAYQLSDTGASRASGRDFTFQTANTNTKAVAVDGGFLYAINTRFTTSASADQIVYPYELNSSGATYRAARGFNLASGNAEPSGADIYEGHLYIVDRGDNPKVFVYELTDSGATRRANKDWNLGAGADPLGIAIDNLGLAYVVRRDSRAVEVHEITANGAIRRISRDFTLAATNDDPTGISVGNGFFYVGESRSKIFVYEHYDSPPEFPTDVGPAQVFVRGVQITPIIIPDAGGVPAARYSIAGLPDGLQFDAATRTISGTPTTTGQGTVTVTADNTPQS